MLLSGLTRALIKGLPRLFIKYQTDANRIANVLLIPPLMNTELYLEMRMMTVSCIFDAFRSIFHKYPLLVLYRSLLLLLNWAALICDPQAYATPPNPCSLPPSLTLPTSSLVPRSATLTA
jgi:hypothetical protein